MSELTPRGFKEDVHGKLASRGFNPRELEKVHAAYNDALVTTKRDSFDKKHFDEMWGHMETHEGLKNLSDHKREAAREVFMKHLKVEEKEEEAT